MRIIGIDPGLRGAIAMFDGTDLFVEDMPIVEADKRGNDLNYDGLRDLFQVVFAGADHAFIEHVGAMPKQGVSSMFKFGKVYGGVIMAVSYAEIPRTFIAPTKWKIELGLTSNKERSRKRALECFPKYSHLFARKKDDGRSEASLLARYGRMLLMTGKVR